MHDSSGPMIGPGTSLGPYEILSAIGEGGMGRVYRAHDARLGRDVAIKVSHQPFSDRFEHEARAAAALNHPNIAQLYDIGSNYLVMELVDATGKDRLIGPLQLPDGTQTLAGFSLHPDGTRFLTSAPVWPFDIWLMDNFDPPRRPLAWLLGK